MRSRTSGRTIVRRSQEWDPPWQCCEREGNPEAWIQSSFVLKRTPVGWMPCAKDVDGGGFAVPNSPSLVTRGYASPSQRRQGGGRGWLEGAGVTRSKSVEMRRLDGTRAIGGARWLSMGAQDLGRPEGWSCRCCVTRGRETVRRLVLSDSLYGRGPRKTRVGTGWCDATAR